jgi:hypothetical protein
MSTLFTQNREAATTRREVRLHRAVDRVLGVQSPQPAQPAQAARHPSKFSRRAIADANSGEIEGHVRDRDANAPAVGATIIATSSDAQRSVVSHDNGEYVVRDLPPGRYVLAVYYNDESDWHVIEVAAGFATLVDIDIVDPYGPARPFFP